MRKDVESEKYQANSHAMCHLILLVKVVISYSTVPGSIALRRESTFLSAASFCKSSRDQN